MAHSTLDIHTPAATRTHRAAVLVFCILLPALLTGCAKASVADLVPDGPPLTVPEPPPREIAPVEVVAEAPPPPPPAPAVPEPAATAPRTPPRQPARTEPKTETPAPVAAQPAPPAPEPREIRAVPSAAAAAEEKKIRELMSRAAQDLNRVDYRKLSPEGKSQYDQSKRFNEQAEQALKEKNIVYAMTLADKAATLAAELLGR
jgi:hypothetical protein